MAPIPHLLLLVSSIACLQSFALTLAASPSNIQTFFPSISTPAFTFTPLAPPTRVVDASQDRKALVKTIVATALISFALSFLLLFAFLCFTNRKQRNAAAQPSAPTKSLPLWPKYRHQRGGSDGSLLINENGLNAAYWKEPNNNVCESCKKAFKPSTRRSRGEEKEERQQVDDRIQEKPLLPPRLPSLPRNLAAAPEAQPTPAASTEGSASLNSVPAPPQPPVVPPPRPSGGPAAPPPPAPPAGRLPGAPPPPAPPGGGSAGPRASPGPVPVEAGKKMKPLHWDKLNTDAIQHSVIWNRMSDSFTFDEGFMEELFGAAVTSKKNPKAAEVVSMTPAAPTQICLLEPRKSQNIAIVLRSLSLSREDVVSALQEGHGLSTEVIEKLTKIAPTKEEEAAIRNYDGNLEKLSNAESFLFHLYRAAPSPFTRFEAMLLKSNYKPELAQLKQSLQSLELACQELRNRGVFLKILEAVRKAGNRMNAGTARGNAQAFDLSALRKLSDVKSTDGSTTLLHFVVNEVVRSEGKRLTLNRNHSLKRSGTNSSDRAGTKLERATSRGRAEREMEYMSLGLPIISGLSSELTNVKKAAGIDCDALSATCALLGARVDAIKKFLLTCSDDGFSAKMKIFVNRADEELKSVKEEQDRVLELVKNTTLYYQGALKDRKAHPLQLFIVVRDFLEMVDKVCLDIAKDQEKKRQTATKAKADLNSRSKLQAGTTESSKEGSVSARRPMARFANLPARFMSDDTKSDSSSDSSSDDNE